jgi:thioredoxin 1
MAKVNNGVEEISEKQFESKVNDGIVVVDFFADWCMPCLMMAPVIEDLSKKFKGINFVKVNVDDNSELSKKYKVMSIPTLIIFKEGKEVERINGAIPSEQLEEKLRKLK